MPLTGTYAPSTSNWARKQAELYEATDGKKGGTVNGVPVVVITSIGAKTGSLRKHPVIRVEHDGEYLAVASNGGAPKHPTWFHNLAKHPHVELHDQESKRDYEARQLEGDERETWWARAVEIWPDYAGYQQKTERQIPVFLLSPKD